MAQGDQDQDHLKLLTIFYYIYAGLAALFACFPIFHVIIGLMMVFNPNSFGTKPQDTPPAGLGWVFVGIGSFIILLGWAYAVLVFLGGRFLSRRKHYTACFVIGVLTCLSMPLGTILGVFTLVVLMKPSVKTLFDADPPVPVNPPPH